MYNKDKILDGKALAKEILQDVKKEIQERRFVPKLAVILVGNDPASQVYVRHKQLRCTEVGIESLVINLDANVTQEHLLDVIGKLNNDSSINGILLQLPLPPHLDAFAATNAVHPFKDVDGLTSENLGLLFSGYPRVIPCTPLGCLELLLRQTNLKGKNIVVIGRSMLVGKPFAALLTHYDATVTLAHSHTKDLSKICQEAEILIAAIGKPLYFTQKYIQRGSLIIDVGINRVKHHERTRLVGDVDFEDVYEKCAAITPVPGGVGPLTVAFLMKNVLLAYKLQQ